MQRFPCNPFKARRLRPRNEIFNIINVREFEAEELAWKYEYSYNNTVSLSFSSHRCALKTQAMYIVRGSLNEPFFLSVAWGHSREKNPVVTFAVLTIFGDILM